MFRADSCDQLSKPVKQESIMRAETETLVDEIRQAISLLRRHL